MKRLILFLAVSFSILLLSGCRRSNPNARRVRPGAEEQIRDSQNNDDQVVVIDPQKELPEEITNQDSIDNLRRQVIDSIESEMNYLSKDSTFLLDVDVRNVGSARVLSGKICICSIFAQKTENPWKDTEIQYYCQMVSSACEWLTKEASKWYSSQKSVDIHELIPEFLCVVPNSTPAVITSSPNRNQSHDYIYKFCNKMLSASSLPDLFGLNEWAKNNYDCDQLVVLFFLKGEGRSFCLPTTNEILQYDPQKYTTEYCILFNQYEDTKYALVEGSIIHEILHAFGAWDLYEVTPNMKKLASRAMMLFPNSIMIAVDNIENKTIDDITAYLVGLHNDPQAYYKYFDLR